MKTQTTNQTKIGGNTNKRNFFQKTFILFAFTVFSFFAFKAKAQTYFEINVNNFILSSGCDVTITVWDGSSNVLWSQICYSGTTPNNFSGCLTNVDHIDIDIAGCSTFTYGSVGLFNSGPISLCGSSCATNNAATVSNQYLPSCSANGIGISIDFN